MISRIWRGQATTANADAYRNFVTTKIFPSLEKIPGHRGAYLMRRENAGQVEFVVITLWDSMEAIHQFAGAHAEAAVVEPEARAILSTFDNFVHHYEIIHQSKKQ
jgi:heme-degrading monooxygenase HmoA